MICSSRDVSTTAFALWADHRVDSEIDPGSYTRSQISTFQVGTTLFYPPFKVCVSRAIDHLGALSGTAQRLAQPITSYSKVLATDVRLYLLCDDNEAVGILKVGKKKLFLYDSMTKLRECTPLCVLDFFVLESMQRQGCGRALFDHMITNERVHPANLAYDRPSPKLTSFLRKHFGLAGGINQSNSFLIFHSFWTPLPVPDHVDSTSSPSYSALSSQFLSSQLIPSTVANSITLPSKSQMQPPRPILHPASTSTSLHHDNVSALFQTDQNEWPERISAQELSMTAQREAEFSQQFAQRRLDVIQQQLAEKHRQTVALDAQIRTLSSNSTPQPIAPLSTFEFSRAQAHRAVQSGVSSVPLGSSQAQPVATLSRPTITHSSLRPIGSSSSTASMWRTSSSSYGNF